MIIYQLPDLGEGLPDAIIREWYIRPGDHLKADQPMVAMETAKALVDVPAPFDGKVEKLFGKLGDTIETGQPLIGFEGESEGQENVKSHPAQETEPTAPAKSIQKSKAKATPAVRALAKKLGVNLEDISSQGEFITQAEVEQAAQKGTTEALPPSRRAMVLAMTDSHHKIVPITLCDDADIAAWKQGQDITLRLIRAITAGYSSEPILNATFDDQKTVLTYNPEINLGIAIDTPHGLYVPVIKNLTAFNNEQLREKINQFKQQAQQKTLAAADLHGATLTLTNYGAIAGRYGTPIIIPPMVAIIGVGKAREAVVADQGKVAIHRIIPLSITVDHRVVTGGEAARFLKAMMEDLAKPV